jgi:hypothetical protein
VPNTLYIEGLTTSTALSDTFLMVLADPDRDGQFQIEANRQVTVASISFSPYVLGPGDLLTITLEPAIPPLAFDELTAAEWQGSYTPPNSPPTPPFTVSYSAEHFRESSPGVAVLVAGDGSMTDAPSFEELNEGGVVWGSFMFHLAGCLLLHRTPPSPFSLNDAEFLWYKIHYPYEGYGYLDEPPTLEPIPLEELPTRWWPPVVYPEFLDTNYYYHTACVLMVDENPETIAGAPDSLLVDVVTYWPIGFEVDRVENVVLSRVPDDDGHPNHLVYRSDLSRPIVFFQQEVPKEYFPDFTILYAVEDGPVVVVSKGMEAP